MHLTETCIMVCAFQGSKIKKRILILANPGHGKSMLTHLLTLQWADTVNPVVKESHGESEIPDSEPTKEEKRLLQKFSILVFINLGMISLNSTLLEVFSEQIVMRNRYDIIPLIDYIELNQGDCCLILDGWDQYNPSSCPKLTAIINGRHWPDAYMVITSRIREQTVLPENIDNQCMVKGFSKSKAVLYIDKILKAYKKASKHDTITTFIDNHKLWDIFRVPLLLNFLCMLYMSNVQLSDKVTLLFTNVIQLTIGKQKLKDMKLKSGSSANTPLESYKSELMSLGELGLSGLTGENTQTAFNKQKVMDTVGESGLKLGLLQMVKSQDSKGPVLYQFPHKSIQEFASAVYIANSDQGLNTLLEYLDSLIKVYDHQLLVMFVCGLNPESGQRLIQKIQDISESSKVTAAQCPGFSIRGWETDNPDDVDIAWRHTQTANDVSPFVIKCCWEKSKSNDEEYQNKFPFTQLSSDTEYIQIKPILNCKILSIEMINKLIELNQLSLSLGNKVSCYNINITQNNIDQVNSLFSHLSDNTHTDDVIITNVSCDIKSNILHHLIRHYDHLLYFGMFNVCLCVSDQVCVLQRLSIQDLVYLYLDKVSLSGCEKALCDTLTKLPSLRRLYLRSLSLPGWESRLCEAVSHINQLQLLDLKNTDLSAAGDAIPHCVNRLGNLKYLNLNDTHLTDNQTRHVVLQLPACPALLALFLYDLPVYSAVTDLQKVLPQLTLLRLLNVSNGGLDTAQAVAVISCLPSSVQVMEAYNDDTSDGIVSMIELLPSLPHLLYIVLNLSSVSHAVIHQLRSACQDHQVSLIWNHDEYRQHGPGMAQTASDIQNECI